MMIRCHFIVSCLTQAVKSRLDTYNYENKQEILALVSYVKQPGKTEVSRPMRWLLIASSYGRFRNAERVQSDATLKD